jgi:hypothetical protein
MPYGWHASGDRDQFPANRARSLCYGQITMMTPSEFEARLRELIASRAGTVANPSCIECEACQSCLTCTFCRSSVGLVRCHYCVDCGDCTDSSHCRKCTGCLGCKHCIACERCTGSAYLMRCVGLSGCSYCFGCVGLSNKDFHVLNEPYERSAYFALTNALARKLGI